jgi:hypothetical protein
MYFISECVTCVVVSFTLGALLFTFSALFLMIKDGLESRTGMFERSGRLVEARAVAVAERYARSSVR